MSTCISNMSSFDTSMLNYDIRTKHSNTIGNVMSDPSVEKYKSIYEYCTQKAESPDNENTLKSINTMLKQQGFSDNMISDKENNIQSIIDKTQQLQSQLSDVNTISSKKDKIVTELSDKLADLRSTIRNQQLQAKVSLEHAAQIESAVNDNPITTGMSLHEICGRLVLLINTVKEDYVDLYANLMKQYTEMYESFNTNVQKAASDAVTAGDDGNNVSFDTAKMQAGYNAFQKDVDRLNNELGSIKNWDTMPEEQRQNMITTLEPAYKVDSSGKITFNMDQYNTVSGTYPSGIKNGKVSTASYQAWLATFNAAGNTFQSNMQSFAQRYSQANNTFDNLNKVLSSVITSMADTDRECIRSFS